MPLRKEMSSGDGRSSWRVIFNEGRLMVGLVPGALGNARQWYAAVLTATRPSSANRESAFQPPGTRNHVSPVGRRPMSPKQERHD